MNTKTLGLRIQSTRLSRKLTIDELAAQVGIHKSTISRYERGEIESPKIPVVNAIANALQVNPSWLIGKSDDAAFVSNIIPMPGMNRIPLLGRIACGAPILAEDHIEDYVDIPKNIHADFALTCQGNSMINARIFDGDIVYIRQQDTVESGEIAAVLIDNDATLKRIRIFEDHVSLEPENPQYRPIVLWGEEMNTVRILGKAVAFTSAVR